MNEVELFITKLRENMPSLREKYNVKTLGIFGSYIRGEQIKKSDVDILIEFEKPIGLFDFSIFKDNPCASVSSAQSVFNLNCSPANRISALICVHLRLIFGRETRRGLAG